MVPSRDFPQAGTLRAKARKEKAFYEESRKPGKEGSLPGFLDSLLLIRRDFALSPFRVSLQKKLTR
jgi:hypothetical protein